MEDGAKSERSWQEIARDVTEEKDPQKVVDLSADLIRALDAEIRMLDEKLQRA